MTERILYYQTPNNEGLVGPFYFCSPPCFRTFREWLLKDDPTRLIGVTSREVDRIDKCDTCNDGRVRREFNKAHPG